MKKSVMQLYVLLLILQLHGETDGQDLSQAFNDREKLQLPSGYRADWMKSLDSNLLLSQITLPGTHDTMALYGGPAAECQAWSLEDQLRAGIRYLDLRVFEFENTLHLMHGVIYEHSAFTTVVETLKKFLSEFPSETVLVRVKPDMFDKSKVQGMVQKIIENDNNVWVESTIPHIGEVRGKFVFVQKDDFKLGIPLLETDTKDDYKVVHIAKKEEETGQHLSQAAKECGGNSVVLTYSSGTGIGTFKGMFLTPKKVAEKIDPWLYEHLQMMLSNKSPCCLGIIAMDFPGFDLIQTIIKFNNV
ncbi:1-phosphatidylinositol phosphodiesterase-like [Electrophorus electricus]|uniref:Phosphatidylinositol-specific phospholipase C X domain-containing protein n=1 Tax=Electrophorus electricus TaxID=8005 RepID=A0A4W4FBZ2_ELEEL|nr:1-phosphatidylinositol phosphodiesterase-like [Electrophorus electricus]